jgi:hypothetical protein
MRGAWVLLAVSFMAGVGAAASITVGCYYVHVALAWVEVAHFVPELARPLMASTELFSRSTLQQLLPRHCCSNATRASLLMAART